MGASPSPRASNDCGTFTCKITTVTVHLHFIVLAGSFQPRRHSWAGTKGAQAQPPPLDPALEQRQSPRAGLLPLLPLMSAPRLRLLWDGGVCSIHCVRETASPFIPTLLLHRETDFQRMSLYCH